MRTVVVAVALVVAVAVVVARPSGGQDRTDERLSDLETRVAALEAEVYRGEATEESTGEGSSEDLIRLEGTGLQVSDPFTLEAGRYKVSAQVEVASFDGFTLYIYGPSDFDELVFNEIIDTAGTFEGSAVLDVETDGEYYISTENTRSAWVVTIERI